MSKKTKKQVKKQEVSQEEKAILAIVENAVEKQEAKKQEVKKTSKESKEVEKAEKQVQEVKKQEAGKDKVRYTTKEAVSIIFEKTGKSLTTKQFRRYLRSLDKYNDKQYTHYALTFNEILAYCNHLINKVEEEAK